MIGIHHFMFGAALLASSYPAVAQQAGTYQAIWDQVADNPACVPAEYTDLILVTCKADLTLWYFTLPNHPAHPGVIQRTVKQNADGGWNSELHGRSFASEAEQPAFEAWLAQIQELDRQMSEALKKMHDAPAAPSN